MPAYTYTVLENGIRREGTLDASDPLAAATRLKQDRLIILRLEETANRQQPTAHRPPPTARRSPLERHLCRILVRPARIELSLGQLAQMIHAGVPILTALRCVADHAPRLLARIFHAIAQRIRAGQPLKTAFEAEAPFLGDIALGLIGIGEANGTLDEMLRYIADLLERRRKVKAQVLDAMTYPTIVLVGAFGLAYYMVNRVIPQIMVFIGTQNPEQLPRITQYLIHTTDYLQVNGIYFLLAPPLLLILLAAGRTAPTTAPHLDYALLHIPPIGKALLEHANALWCRTLGALLGSGIPILAALELVGQTSGNAAYRIRFERIRQRIRQGATFADAMRRTGLDRLCPMAHTMVDVSEKSGHLDENLLHCAAFSEEQLSRRVAFLAKMIEPAVFVIVGGIVGFVYFAFFLAMLTATTSATGR